MTFFWGDHRADSESIIMDADAVSVFNSTVLVVEVVSVV